MSGKLDQSLDEILSSTRGGQTARGGKSPAQRVRSRTSKSAVAAPVGGIKKTIRSPKNTGKAIPTGPSAAVEGKVIVSNLPKDVSEEMIKEYFGKSIGPIKRVELSYGPDGNSRGIATIVFTRQESAAKAVETLNGVKVDGKSMKVDIVLDAQRAAALPPPKGLGDRISGQTKSQPKSAATVKTAKATSSTRGGKVVRGRGGKAKNARPAKKTAEELDSEMVDYFGNAGNNDTAGSAAAQPAANGDANMDDEIL